MNVKQLKADMRATIDAANKRLKRLEHAEILSPAYNAVMETGGKFSIKSNDLKALRKEYARATNFMQMKTSSVTGAKSYEKSLAKHLSNKNITNEQRKTLWDAFRKIQQISPNSLNMYGSDRLVNIIYDEMEKSGDNENTIKRALDKLNEEYIKQQEKNRAEFGDIWDL